MEGAAPFHRLARMLAGALRRTVRALEGGENDIEATRAALAQRFPGAPDHWLRYIAARAPHLAEARETESGGVAPRTTADQRRWWWPLFRARRRTPLDLAITAPTREEPAPPTELTATARAKTLRHGLRPKLRVITGEPQQSKPAPIWDWKTHRRVRVLETPAPSNTPESAKREPEPLHVMETSSKPRAHLKLAVGPKVDTRVTQSFGQPRDAIAPEPSAASKMVPSRRAERRSIIPATTPKRAEFVSQPPLGPSRASQPMWTHVKRPKMSQELTWPEQPRATPSASPLWQDRPTLRPLPLQDWKAKDAHRHWPALLSLESLDAGSAPLQLPNIERLRAEQDFNAWSG